jgi:hypothetical protein
MRRVLAYLIVTVPLLVVRTSSAPASISEYAPLATTELLSKIYAADERCHFLKPAEHLELGRLVAHVELAATEIEGASSTNKALQKGRTLGQAVDCSPALERQTISVFAAGRRALASIKDDDDTKGPAVLLPADGPSPNAVEPSPGDDLAGYQRRMAAYLTELRCHYLSHRQARKFWRLVIKDHKLTVDKYGEQTVAPAKSQAEAFSSRQGCDGRSEAFVREAYRELASR